MGLHKDFPESPFEILDPDVRWFPSDDLAARGSMDKLMPPLVGKIRREVKSWRDNGYEGATETSKSLLNWWFNHKHLRERPNSTLEEFKYYFAQREALETIIYLYDAAGARDRYDLMRYDSSGAVSTGMFDETWLRFVVKMATGSGKTKVLSLAIAWSYFHKLYEPESELARNFLLITPNIIVLDRIRKDFDALKIFFDDPVLPDNGIDGHNWRDDFQLTVHIQDEVNVTRSTGNLFLTNIHRVYSTDDTPPAPDDENTMEYFLGERPTGATIDSYVDLGMIVRDVSELMVLNDEAHHIHDPSMAWFKSIEDIHNQLKQKGGSLALQVDTTATPKHTNGAIFVQTVADYPLVEAIAQNVVKHPLVPDDASRLQLSEQKSAKYTEKYSDYLHLGVVEWREANARHERMGKKAILFVMTSDTKNCDEVAEYLEHRYPDFQDAVLVIHTKKNGELTQARTGKAKEELDLLRERANKIDSPESPYKAIVSVMMLKEGWDVRNVTTIVGLRAYSGQAQILPEQTLGRGLRLMYPEDNVEEYLSVVGTDDFMEFVERIQEEGVQLERRPMGQGTEPKAPLVIEVDDENVNKDIEALDLEIPILTPRTYREYKNLSLLDVQDFGNERLSLRDFSREGRREIVFKDITTGETTHITYLDSSIPLDYRSVVGYFAQIIMKDLRLVSGYDVLYGKLKTFIREELFDEEVTLEDPNTLRNLATPAASKTVIESFKRSINDLTVEDAGGAEIKDSIRLSQTRPFVAKNQEYVLPSKSVFNRIIGDSYFELEFASFLEKCNDIISYGKNYLAVHFKLDYVNADGEISNYYPDFLAKESDSQAVIVETKGQADLDVPLKMRRLRQWCDDVNEAQSEVEFDFVYVDQETFDEYKPESFRQLMETFTEYKV